MIGLERSLLGDAQVGRLVVRQLGQVDAEGGQVGLGDLLVQGLGEHVDADLVLAGVAPQVNLGKDLKKKENMNLSAFFCIRNTS